MEENIGENKKEYYELGLSLGIKVLYFIIEILIIVISVYRYRVGYMSDIGLIAGMLAIFCIADVFRHCDIRETSDYYEDRIEELESKVNAINQENIDLRDIIRNIQKKTTKTKKND